uniref:acyloxyacyl hydrolase-like n=1 Tax=Styela clava TaxID=7725 RepID=UPI00193A4F22|nr:acyloxyacyl hydrolase-like [Styela clava]
MPNIGCVLIIGLVEQVAQVHAIDIVTAADMLCSYLPSPLSTACDALLDEFGPSLVDMIYHKETPDLICHDIGFCTQDPGKNYCHLFPMPSKFRSSPGRPISSSFSSRRLVSPYYQLPQQRLKICDIPEVKEICDLINRFSDDHLPIEDEDDDKFSQDVGVLRGFMWRGRDCNDRKPEHYPGRIPLNKDKVEDSNCNGIYKTFEDVLVLLANEGDWPMLSSTTAYSTTNSWPESVQGPIDSLYLRLRNHNLCNHRDYQNIGVNGARSSSMNDIVKSIGKNQALDKPAIVVLALIGNDVCNGHIDTIAHMTTAAEFHTNTMVTLKYLDTVLPNGSSVIISGLADGRVLWDTLSQSYQSCENNFILQVTADIQISLLKEA